MKRRGFTLTELLVVVAILAILSAVLFPVLAQARQEAQRSICVSRFRDASRAHSLYSDQDYDQKVVPSAYTTREDPLNDRKWPQLLSGYLKNHTELRCPSDTTTRPKFEDFYAELSLADPVVKHYFQASRTNLGYNSLYLSPFKKVSRTIEYPMPVLRSTIEEEASTVEFVDSVWLTSASGAPSGGGNYAIQPPCRYAEYYGNRIDTVIDEAPTENTSGWNPSEPVITHNSFGGAFPRHRGKMTVAFLDGHVRTLTPPELMKGCRVEPQWRGTITDLAAYVWDLKVNR